MRTRLSQTLAVVIVFSTIALFVSPAHADGWRAGVSRVKITPTEPVWMAGYAARTKPAEGTLNELHAKALALEDAQGMRVLLLTLDVCGIDRETSDRIRDRLRDAAKLERDAIAICVSHTHSGPVIGHNLRATYSFGPDEAEKIRKYTRWLEDQCVEVGTGALAGLRPVTISHGVGSASFATNRRANKEPDVRAAMQAAGADAASGEWRQALKGPADHDLPVLRLTGADGKPIAVVWSYACHATTLDGYQWSGDWPGFANEKIEAELPGAIALFVTGCGADQNPLPRRSVELARGYGDEAAAGVRSAMKNLRPVAGRLATAYAEIDLPFGQLPTREQLEQQKASKDPKDRYLARRASMLLERLERDGKLRATYAYPVQTWRLGDGPTLVFLGGEVVVDYALRLKNEAGGPLWPIGYANDVMAYIPSKRVLDEGGYEGGGAMVYYGLPTSWGAEVEEKIVAEVKRQTNVVNERKEPRTK